MDMNERVVVVTGAGGGIGAALATRLAGQGAQLALTSRSQEKLDAAAALLDQDRVLARAADLTDEDQVRDLFSAVGERFGRVDALVNVAGLSIPGPVAETSLEDYQAVWNANVTTAFLCSKHAVGLLTAGEAPQIVNVSSVAGLNPNPVAPLYCTAKAALEMFTRAFAMQAKEQRIRVSAISPGGADTGFWGDRPIDRSKLLSAEEVTDALMFVLSAGPGVQVGSIELAPFYP
ncbi:SDR family oxidoreductase [Ruania rhizosphaerae]|uniref:SDR family oxidoreductase n=1 Tax=Ruania rhizosphaerae TaxID=1840413 RepID=UPI00135AE9A8|nr:SDR family oxidoreductase [Ruania rhizosphaerae]